MWRVLQHTTNQPIVVTYMPRLQKQLKYSFFKLYSILAVSISNKVSIKHPVAHRSISAKQRAKVMHTTKITTEHFTQRGGYAEIRNGSVINSCSFISKIYVIYCTLIATECIFRISYRIKGLCAHVKITNIMRSEFSDRKQQKGPIYTGIHLIVENVSSLLQAMTFH